MLRFACIVLPAVALGIVGYYLGLYTSGPAQAVVSAIAGALGGAGAAYAATGVLERVKANKRQAG